MAVRFCRRPAAPAHHAPEHGGASSSLRRWTISLAKHDKIAQGDLDDTVGAVAGIEMNEIMKALQ
ncbi:MAG TPA: hypothetical protein VFF72_09535 [Caldimonas sp.]|nr:hypothetical protein [Caldimonas sp.]